MSLIKSFSVGNGDFFYIRHNSDNFSIIDCCLNEDRKEDLLDEIRSQKSGKGIWRFIATHPDDDHIRGLVELDDELEILNFYCVENQATKADETDDFKRYRTLHDGEKSFHISAGCSRAWMNKTSTERGSAGIQILWPETSNEHFKDALSLASEGGSPNNISPVIKYSLENGATAIWMGDLETDFMDKIKDEIDLPPSNILFAPHHGRDSGKVPNAWLEQMSPDIIVIGEAPSEHLNYYSGYKTLTQNSAGDIAFECVAGAVHTYVSESSYTAPFLEDLGRPGAHGLHYLGTLEL